MSQFRISPKQGFFQDIYAGTKMRRHVYVPDCTYVTLPENRFDLQEFGEY